MKIRKAVIFLWIAILAAIMSRRADAQTINWGNAPNLSPINFDSEGSLLDGTFTFSLGVFGSGYDPAVESPGDWFSNWTELDVAVYNPSVSLFSDAWVVTDDAYAGRQAYIWIYNQTAPVDETAEWVLITDDDGLGGDDWIVPVHNDQTALTLEWRVSNATTPLYGGLNGTPGPGVYSSTPPSYELQTFTFPPAVPEPGVFAFFGGALFLGMGRRRRRRPVP